MRFTRYILEKDTSYCPKQTKSTILFLWRISQFNVFKLAAGRGGRSFWRVGLKGNFLVMTQSRNADIAVIAFKEIYRRASGKLSDDKEYLFKILQIFPLDSLFTGFLVCSFSQASVQNQGCIHLANHFTKYCSCKNQLNRTSPVRVRLCTAPNHKVEEN